MIKEESGNIYLHVLNHSVIQKYTLYPPDLIINSSHGPNEI